MIRAKMRCTQVEKPYPGTEIVRMQPVYDADPAGANHDWSAATPAGKLELYITNPAAQGHFATDSEYFVDISPA
ncbi:MAG TPA: hypothetical protein VKT52_12640 [Ktedonobacterales bacterium]|nr:hypothetical protein [Ktedonobacterales bacterium]